MTREALANVELVAIFPEGRITATDELNVFKGGYLRILEREEAPVVAIGLGGLWGSMFSRKEKGWRKRLAATEFGRRITVAAERVARAQWEQPTRLREIVRVLSRTGEELHRAESVLKMLEAAEASPAEHESPASRHEPGAA